MPSFHCTGHFVIRRILIISLILVICYSLVSQVFRCVCFYCGKLLLDKDNKRVKDIIRKTQGNPRRRFTLVYDMCKSKVVCDGGNEIENVNPEEGEDGEEVIKGSGCGRYQPLYRRTGIDLNAVWKKNGEKK